MSAKKPAPPVNNHVCPPRLSLMLDNWIRRVLQNPGKIVGEYIRKGDTVVDIGCGPGFFITEMARRVGKSGRVFAVDLQPEMLEKVRKKAEAQNVLHVVSFHCCEADRIGLQLERAADFILAYYVVHELADQASFFREAGKLLKPSGILLVVEPRFHVKGVRFDETIRLAEQSGLLAVAHPRKKGGYSVLLKVREGISPGQS